jgi:hypothetical protein
VEAGRRCGDSFLFDADRESPDLPYTHLEAFQVSRRQHAGAMANRNAGMRDVGAVRADSSRAVRWLAAQNFNSFAQELAALALDRASLSSAVKAAVDDLGSAVTSAVRSPVSATFLAMQSSGLRSDVHIDRRSNQPGLANVYER